MRVKIAVINMENEVEKVHEVSAVRGLEHERGSDENNWIDSIQLAIGGGEGTVEDEQFIFGKGYGLVILECEHEEMPPLEE